jgi:AraC family transcriptional regulator
MRVEFFPCDSVTEPRYWVRHEEGFAMMWGPGSIEWGSKRSSMERVDYAAGDLGMCPYHEEKWVGLMNTPHLQLIISDEALMAASERKSTEVGLRAYRKFADPRLGALVMAINAERMAGFPSGRLFLESVELALAVALVNNHAVRRPSPRIYRGGLTPTRMRKVVELVHAKMDGDLSLEALADAAGLSITHFSQMFRESTGQSPHQFVLHRRVDRAKELLRAAEMRVLDVAVACGFKSQQHFARIFRKVGGASPTEYRREFAHREQPSAAEQSAPFSNRSFAHYPTN